VTQEDDFDNDGFINYAEFLYETDPTDGTTSLPVRWAGALAAALALLGATLLFRQYKLMTSRAVAARNDRSIS
jgi:hypothetical protein